MVFTVLQCTWRTCLKSIWCFLPILRVLGNINLFRTFLLSILSQISCTKANNPANICWSSRRLQDMSWRRLQYVFSVTIFRLPRRLEDISQDALKTSWRRLGRREIVTLKTCWRRLEDMSWKCLEGMSWRYLEDMSWRCLQNVLETSKTFSEFICI